MSDRRPSSVPARGRGELPDGVPAVRLLIDGGCPFCRAESRWLKRRDGDNALRLIDANDPAFRPEDFGLRRDAVQACLHAILPDGNVVTRMNAVRAAHEAVGRGWIAAPTRWPGLRWIFDRTYDRFAANRIRWGNAALRRSGSRRAAPRAPPRSPDSA